MIDSLKGITKTSYKKIPILITRWGFQVYTLLIYASGTGSVFFVTLDINIH